MPHLTYLYVRSLADIFRLSPSSPTCTKAFTLAPLRNAPELVAYLGNWCTQTGTEALSIRLAYKARPGKAVSSLIPTGPELSLTARNLRLLASAPVCASTGSCPAYAFTVKSFHALRLTSHPLLDSVSLFLNIHLSLFLDIHLSILL